MSSQIDLNQAWLLGAATAVTAGLCLKYAKMLYGKLRFEYQYMKHPRLVPFDERRVCPSDHKWNSIQLALRGLAPGEYQVCGACGLIGGAARNDLGQKLMVSLEVLAQVKEGLELAAQHEFLRKEVADRVDALTEIMLERYIAKEFPSDGSDTTFINKMLAFADYVFEAQREAAEKVNAEIQAKNRLEAKYAGWSSRVKGNA